MFECGGLSFFDLEMIFLYGVVYVVLHSSTDNTHRAGTLKIPRFSL